MSSVISSKSNSPSEFNADVVEPRRANDIKPRSNSQYQSAPEYSYSYGFYNQYPQHPPGYGYYPAQRTLHPYTSTSSYAMPMTLSHESSSSGSSSYGQYSDSSASSAPSLQEYPEYPLPPQYQSQGIEFSYAGSASVSNKKQPKVKYVST